MADEPEVFWDGADAVDHVREWRSAHGVDDHYGSFGVPEGLNGPSGDWVARNVLDPLGVQRGETWITDCLDTYRMSTGVERMLGAVYTPMAQDLGWAESDLQSHPSETRIVSEALELHSDRLLDELVRCLPELVVTLGNAAGRVVASLLGHPFRRLSLDSYGTRFEVQVSGRRAEFLPLAHPAAPARYQEAHRAWCALETRSG